MIGSVISVGAKGAARWMYVTRTDADCVWGRMWSARKEQWTKTSTFYARDAIGKKQPNCAKPRPPLSAHQQELREAVRHGPGSS